MEHVEKRAILLSPFQRFFKEKMNSGVILLFVTMLALFVANSPLQGLYKALWEVPVHLQVGSFNLFSHHGEAMNLGQFINDVLMTIFFFSVGLEIKREVMVGELSSFRQALLPLIAAVGGMIVPVAIYLLTSHDELAKQGAAIPMATDIAFSIGVLSLLGKRVPISLKIFLTTFAVADDIGGIVVIALAYSEGINWMSLLPALGFLLVLTYGGYRGVQSKLFYMLLGIVVWHFFLESGIHCTISGVLVALTIPAKPIIGVGKYIRSIRSNLEHFPDTQENNIILTGTQTSVLKKIESASDRVISPLQSLEDDLHSIVNYIIMPLFAFSNAGITLGNVGVEAFQGVTASVAMGLLFGKVIGLFGFSWILIQTKIAHMPFGMNWKNLFGVSLLGGIGFTVSLFMANLSFGPIPEVGAMLLNDAKLGVLTGSLLSGVLGYVYLSKVLPKIKNGHVVHE